ncbi:multidrug efflux RND transporter permease subunit [Candidatus Laterigemmans baculatus]|uniref:multidrug efflux RND transporter permease subunit n=1 Tax=Candidatus Laterigemmans baculatus TaxID=2770505 RepID=UPI0013DB88BA|nr:multidrug efflux RND transporter permease subunit [Candidatus Laterigemmans baculatus]
MRFTHFFVDRPIFATVVSTLIVLIGALSYNSLPVSQYPEVALPTVVVTATYAGATAETIAETVATPIEQEINGVENMLYMESSSTATGTMTLNVTFAQGTDLDEAQVLVQNRVAIAEPKLPGEVRQIGVTTRKSSPDLLLVVNLISPDNTRDSLYISNFANLRIRDVLARLDGVGNVTVFGSREYSMRVWLDMDKIASLELTASDVVQALREQNVQVASGAIGQPPLDDPGAFQFNVSSQGRLTTAEEFGDIVVKADQGGRLVRVRDVARIELGAVDYTSNSYLDEANSVGLGIFQRPGSNAISTAEGIIATMEELSADFPPGLEHRIIYNPTEYVADSINQVYHTLFEAALLVFLTVFVFLQNWRAVIIPLVAIPVSLIGTFAAMQAIGFSLNSLSLFGLVLAIGIVVDDAIVVVENVERLMAKGLSPREAAHQTMDEVGSALIAMTLVLIAVFVPTAFLEGITGQFYRQFAVTIAVSTAISAVVSLTLSPAMCALFLKEEGAKPSLLDRLSHLLFGWLFKIFNRIFDFTTNIYAGVIGRLLRVSFVSLLIYAGLLGMTWFAFNRVPMGFIPDQDQGYFIISLELPSAASLDRTDAVAKKVRDVALNTPGVGHAVSVVGFSGATRSNASNAAAVFVILDKFDKRVEAGIDSAAILANLRQGVAAINEAIVFVIPPPAVPGIGTGGGFKMQVQDYTGSGGEELQRIASSIAAEANQVPGLAQVYSTFRADTPLLYTDVDRTKVRMMNIPVGNVFDTLQIYLGSIYVNDFNFLGRTFRVTAQAEPEYRDEEGDILRLRTRSSTGDIVPLGSVVDVRRISAPNRVVRYNLFPAADVSGSTMPGFSSGQALEVMERIAAEKLPPGYGFEWTDLAYQQSNEGNTAVAIFAICVLFVFLALAAQYESWLLPLAVILIVPMSILCALAGVWFRGMDNNILTQIGFVVLVALACKNAILIVEFAKQLEDEGRTRFEAAVEACRLRLRPILMTAFAFILGVVPLVIATGAGSEMRRALGTAVFSGMLGVTLFGLFLTPVFYYVLRRFSRDPNAVAVEGAAVPAVEATPRKEPVARKPNPVEPATPVVPPAEPTVDEPAAEKKADEKPTEE